MKSTKILFVFFVILLAVTIYFLYPSGAERVTSYGTVSPDIAVDSASVFKIEIRKPQSSLTLENVGGSWMITTPIYAPANASLVSQFISKFKKFKVSSLVSSNPDRQSLFQVDTSGTQLTISDRTGKTVSLVIGKSGPSFTEIYFRLSNSNDVFLGEGIELWALGREVKEWRDKTIFQTVSDSVQEISVEYRSKRYLMYKDTVGWKIGSDTIETSLMSSMLSTLENLSAEDFVDTLPKFTTQPLRVSLSFPEEVRLDFYPQPPDSLKYIVQSSKKQQLYVVNKWDVETLLRPLEKYIKKGK